MTAVTEFIIRPSKDYEGKVIELEAFETFGGLYEKLADANDPDVMKWMEYEAVVVWGYKDYGESTRSLPWRDIPVVMAAQAVYDVPELLELIILQLPMKDMQRCRAVGIAWREAVDSSIQIKRALFQVPGMPKDLAPDHQVHSFDDSRHINRGDNGDHYALHPFIIKVTNINDLLRQTEHLRHVFLSQPPTMIGLTRMFIYGPIKGHAWWVRLEPGETFGSLHTKIDARTDLKKLLAGKAGVGLRWA
ncbi:hypothetical protein LTR22_023611 [Elasticomyces elasticus]|nr:hypothetical protein LTR22_023611 [Elasticomyces elasticus]KAK4905978.1 hypothetical protein LTR49_024791 [Elasticomyces elasticus]KAK5756445.1 hypothetical protein LTS12_013399 [Elasticomyces elasticus]